MVEVAAPRSRLIADGGCSEKERDAEGSDESGEGGSTARQINALGDAKPGRGGGLAGWARLPAWGNSRGPKWPHLPLNAVLHVSWRDKLSDIKCNRRHREVTRCGAFKQL
jgi:hypothetical protein